jgi:hypothetical protein
VKHWTLAQAGFLSEQPTARRIRNHPGSIARLNPTIHPTMAISHDEVAGNRIAFHMAMAVANNANAELAPTAQVLSAGGAISGDNQKTIGTSAIRANDKAAPNSSALRKPFMSSVQVR